MSELLIPQLDRTYTFGDDVTLEEAAAEVRGKINPDLLGTRVGDRLNSLIDSAVQQADPTRFAIDRSLFGEAVNGIKLGFNNFLGSTISGAESVPEAIFGTELFDNYFQDIGTDIMDEGMREYRPGRSYEWAGGIGNALGSIGGFMAGMGAAAVTGGAVALTTPISLPAGAAASGFSLAAGLALGAASSGDEANRRAQAGGATEEEARISTVGGALLGLTDALPVTRFLPFTPRFLAAASGGKLGALTKQRANGLIPDDAEYYRKLAQIRDESSILQRYAQKIAADAGLEGSQEALQAIGQNLIEHYVYNPNQDIVDWASIEEGLYGGTAGGIMSLITAPFKIRGNPAGNVLNREKALDAAARTELGRGLTANSPVRGHIDTLPSGIVRTLAAASANVEQKLGTPVQLEEPGPLEASGPVSLLPEISPFAEKLIIPASLSPEQQAEVKAKLGASNVVMEEDVTPASLEAAASKSDQTFRRFRQKFNQAAQTPLPVGAVEADIATLGTNNIKLWSKTAPAAVKKTIDPLQKKLEAVLPGVSILEAYIDPKAFARKVDRLYGKGTSDFLGVPTLKEAGKFTERSQKIGTGEKKGKILFSTKVTEEAQAELQSIVTGLEQQATAAKIGNERAAAYLDRIGANPDKRAVRGEVERGAKFQARSAAQEKLVEDVRKLAGDKVNVMFAGANRIRDMYNKFTKGKFETVLGFTLGTGDAIVLNKDYVKENPGASVDMLVGEEAFHVAQTMFLTEGEQKILREVFTPELAGQNGVDLSAYTDPEMKRLEAQAKLMGKAYAEGLDSIVGLPQKKKGFIRRIMDKLLKGLKSLAGLAKKNNSEYQSIDEIFDAFTSGALARPSEARSESLGDNTNLNKIYASGAATVGAEPLIKSLESKIEPGKKVVKSTFQSLYDWIYSKVNTSWDFFSKYDGLRAVAGTVRKIEDKYNSILKGVRDRTGEGHLNKLTEPEKASHNIFMDVVQHVLNERFKSDTVVNEKYLRDLGITNAATIDKILKSPQSVTDADFFGQDLVHPDPSVSRDMTFRIDPDTILSEVLSETRNALDFLFIEKVEAVIETILNEANAVIKREAVDGGSYVPVTFQDVKDGGASLDAKINQLEQNNVNETLIKPLRDSRLIYTETMKKRGLFYSPSLRSGSFGFKFTYTDRSGRTIKGFHMIPDPNIAKPSMKKARAVAAKFFKDNPLYKPVGKYRDLTSSSPEDVVFELTRDKFLKDLDSSGVGSIMGIFDSITESTDIDEIADFRKKLAAGLTKEAVTKSLPLSGNIPGYLTNQNLSSYLNDSWNSFVTSQANVISRLPNNATLQNDIKKAKGDRSIPEEVTDQIDKVWGKEGYLTESHKISDLAKRSAFTFWLGGNISSAAVNLVGLGHTTLPYLLASADNPAQAMQALTKGTKIALSMTKQLPIKAPKVGALKWRDKFLQFSDKPFDFINKPAGLTDAEWSVIQNIQPTLEPMQLSDVTSDLAQKGLIKGDNPAARAIDTALRGSGVAFAWIEQFNRVATAIAAIELAKKSPKKSRLLYENEGKNRYGEYTLENFVRFSVEKTQFKFDKTERPAYNRGAISGVVTQFLPYQTKVFKYYLGAMNAAMTGTSGIDADGKPIKIDRETRKVYAAMSMYSTMAFVVGGGILGLPAAAIIGDMMSMVAEIFSDEEETPEDFLMDLLNDVGLNQEISAALTNRGVGSLLGLEIGKRTGLEGPRSLFQIALGQKKADPEDFFGPAGGIVGSVSNAARRYSNGDTGLALAELMPPVFKNLFLAAEGDRRVSLSGRELGVESFGGVDMADRVLQAIGFAPTSVIEARTAAYREIMINRDYRDRGRTFANDLKNTYVELLVAQEEGDDDRVQQYSEQAQVIIMAAVEQLQENPDKPFSFNPRNLMRSAFDDYIRRTGKALPMTNIPKVVRPEFTDYLDRFSYRYQPEQ
jgi:hypothetical protein